MSQVFNPVSSLFGKMVSAVTTAAHNVSHSNNVINPPIPYIGGIPGGVHDDLKIVIQGTPLHHDNMFTVNLQCGPNMNPKSDTALHFNVRFHEHCVVRNTLQYGAWGAEERHGGNPFHKGQPFDITIKIKPHQMKVHVNGHHFCDFKHRIGKHQINTLTIDGGVTISCIRFEGHDHHGHHGHHDHHGHHGMFPQPSHASPAFPQPAPPPAYPSNQPIYNPPVPLQTPIPGGIHNGRMVHISGIPNYGCQRFTINLQHGSTGGDIGFHFDVRFATNQIVRNSCISGGWGAEENQISYFPFVQNANFDIMILAEHNKFKIAVNNQHFAEFHHRMRPLNRMDTLSVTGDCRLTQVRFQ